MKLARSIALGVIFAWMSESAVAGSPPLDRPSPPPCCADGQCFANPLTYGVYPTHWRRWPLECMEQAQVPATAPGTLPPTLQKEVQPFERPRPEEEERRAPPPTAPVGEQPSANLAPGVTPRGQGQGGATSAPPPSTAPGAQPPAYPPQQGLPAPQTTPLAPPAAPGAQPSQGPMYKGISPDSPLNRPIPTGDLDPPPALPFGPQSVGPTMPVREARQPAGMSIPAPSAMPAPKQSNDPPPAPPASLSLASWQN